MGFVDGQTTNPSLIAKNPHIRELIASGHKLSNREEMDEYKKIVQTISPLVGDAGVSIEVFSDEKTTAQEMFNQGKEMFSWIPNAYIKYPCTAEGLRAAEMSVPHGMRVNLTLCFFLVKPFSHDVLVAAIRQGLERSSIALRRELDLAGLRNCYASLSRRERQVMALVVTGLLNKQVGGELGISEITVKAHRGQVMQKMKANSLPDLVRMDAKLKHEHQATHFV